jgi:hypothetical protein
MVDELSVVLLVEVVVVVWVVVELVSGVVDWLGEVEGDVEVLGVDCELLGELDVLCAATQTADSSRIAVIRYSFLICVLLVLSACISCGPLRVVGSSAIKLDRELADGFALKRGAKGKKQSCARSQLSSRAAAGHRSVRAQEKVPKSSELRLPSALPRF